MATKYYIVNLQDGSVFYTYDNHIAKKYKNTEYHIVIDTSLDRQYIFEDHEEEIKEFV